MKKVFYIVCCLIILLFVVSGLAVAFRYQFLALYLGLERPTHFREVLDEDTMVPMRDGVRLATDVYRPDAPGSFPTLLVRLPYDKDALRSRKIRGIEVSGTKLFTLRGYNLVVQDTRGRYKSEGDFYPFLHGFEDGKDTVDWIEKQPWHNGQLAAMGASYPGQTAWAMGISAGDKVNCLSAGIVASDLHAIMYRGGAFGLASFAFWSMLVGERTLDWEAGKRAREDNHAALYKLPLIEIDDRLGRDVPHYNDWVSHPTRDSYTEQFNAREELTSVRAPALLLTGWYDASIGEQLRDFEHIINNDTNGALRESRIIVGPWTHLMRGNTEGDANPFSHLHEMFRWNRYWLKGEGELPEKPVKLYVMGANTWREEEAWPLERAVPTPYYLFSGGKANSSAGDGELRMELHATGASSDKYTYDPANPAPTGGGWLLGPGAGPKDQREVESRQDVLVYTSAPMKSPLEVTGYIEMTLFASTSCDDTDFTAKLCDVHPDGTSVNLASGIIRGRYREAGEDTPLLPGEVYRFEIDLWATSNVFLPGHRIRVQVSSSDFPQFDRNLNLYTEDPAHQTEFTQAKQTIYHADPYPSRITLPVVPG